MFHCFPHSDTEKFQDGVDTNHMYCIAPKVILLNGFGGNITDLYCAYGTLKVQPFGFS